MSMFATSGMTLFMRQRHMVIAASTCASLKKAASHAGGSVQGATKLHVWQQNHTRRLVVWDIVVLQEEGAYTR